MNNPYTAVRKWFADLGYGIALIVAIHLYARNRNKQRKLALALLASQQPKVSGDE